MTLGQAENLKAIENHAYTYSQHQGATMEAGAAYAEYYVQFLIDNNIIEDNYPFPSHGDMFWKWAATYPNWR